MAAARRYHWRGGLHGYLRLLGDGGAESDHLRCGIQHADLGPESYWDTGPLHLAQFGTRRSAAHDGNQSISRHRLLEYFDGLELRGWRHGGSGDFPAGHRMDSVQWGGLVRRDLGGRDPHTLRYRIDAACLGLGSDGSGDASLKGRDTPPRRDAA